MPDAPSWAGLTFKSSSFSPRSSCSARCWRRRSTGAANGSPASWSASSRRRRRCSGWIGHKLAAHQFDSYYNRAFLLAALKHFLANEWDKSQRQKRGGGVMPLSLDWQTADTQFQIAATNEPSPEKAFDREWALALLERVITRLREECVRDGKDTIFEQAKGYLMVGEQAIPYADAAQKLNMDEGAVRVAVHRLRNRYRALLRDEIAQTLHDPAQVEEELRALQAALAG